MSFSNITKLNLTLWILLFIFGSSAWSQTPPAYGPVIDLPGTQYAADPAVIEVEGVYYLYPTSTGVSVECWSSLDMEAWTYEGVVWGPAPAGTWNDSEVWAPDVFEHEGQFYLYYTANKRIGVAVADSPTGPFVDVYDHPFIGVGYGDSLFYSIDANVFKDDDGSLYIYATCYIPVSSIRVRPMSDPVTLAGQWRIILIPDIFSWEFVVLEGPWMLKHEQIYYLMYSGNMANTNAYALGYALSTDPQGPYVKYGENPILAADNENEFYGPGHHSVVADEDQNLWMFYHTKVAPTVSWSRKVRKNRIGFDEHENIVVFLDDDDDDNDDNNDNDDDNDDNDNNNDNDNSGNEQDDDDSDTENDDKSKKGSCCG